MLELDLRVKKARESLQKALVFLDYLTEVRKDLSLKQVLHMLCFL